MENYDLYTYVIGDKSSDDHVRLEFRSKADDTIHNYMLTRKEVLVLAKTMVKAFFTRK